MEGESCLCFVSLLLGKHWRSDGDAEEKGERGQEGSKCLDIGMGMGMGMG